LREKYGAQKEEEDRENNANNSGHFFLPDSPMAEYALCSDQFLINACIGFKQTGLKEPEPEPRYAQIQFWILLPEPEFQTEFIFPNI
jgi:hypothetical protein